jgi:hypothetical protein
MQGLEEYRYAGCICGLHHSSSLDVTAHPWCVAKLIQYISSAYTANAVCDLCCVTPENRFKLQDVRTVMSPG